jgi:hypothetical protein
MKQHGHRHAPLAAALSIQDATPAERLAGYAVWAVTVALALVGARDYASGWNDGSRLATVECLVDFHTLAIDESVFLKVPYGRLGTGEPFPYPIEYQDTWLQGTKDRVRVGDHYYSHKSPLPAVLMAGEYAAWRALGGPTARERSDAFCYWMTLGSSGVAFVVSVICTFHLGGVLGLPLSLRLLATGGFACSTVTMAYARHTNDHILLLALACALMLVLAKLPQSRLTNSDGRPALAWGRLVLAGALAGLAYATDLGSGPLLLLATLTIVAYRSRWSWRAIAMVGLAAVPCVAAHHALNFAIGGTLKPLGSVPEYFDWPGTPFHRENLTGIWNHASARAFVLYALAMLFDPLTRPLLGFPGRGIPWRGFLPHNLPLLLLLPGFVTLWRRRPREWPEAMIWGAWAVGTWLAYAALSVNFSGDCCSIRWFVPLLAAGYYALMLLARDDRRYRNGLWLLSLIGLPLGVIFWWQGPGMEPEAACADWLEAAGMVAWLAWLAWAIVDGPADDAVRRWLRPNRAKRN